MCSMSLYGCSLHRSLGVKALVILLTCATQTGGFRCKWSNEGCGSDGECCSKRCELPHPGTNPRCAKSPLYGKCIFPSHCENRLRCSKKRYECCSPEWGSCMNRTDCCNWNHLCVPVPGFIYRRCRWHVVTSAAATTGFSWLVIGIGIVLSQLIAIFTAFPINGILRFP